MGPFGIYDDDDDIITEFHRHLTRTSANTRSTPKFDTMGGGKERQAMADFREIFIS